MLVDAFRASTAHAAVITGAEGAGLMVVAQTIIRQGEEVIVVLPEKDEKTDIEKGTITVASIRRLYESTRTRSQKGRVIIIDYVERMGIPSQNAFLKLLEEPTPGNRFLLLTHDTSSLLPTIASRAQTIQVRPISSTQSDELLTHLNVTDATKRAQLLFIASGRPALLSRLATDDALFAKRASIVKDARTFITGKPYKRLVIAHRYKNDRADALTLLEDTLRLLQRSLTDKDDGATLHALAKLEAVHARISQQGNIRLQLSAAVLL
jgi:replication-associated recombination protein RarA